jgi:hypothetical protein
MRLLKTLFIGGREGLSMGRTAFWLVLGFNLYRLAMHGQDLQPGYMTIIMALLGYTLYGKTHKVKLGAGNTITMEPKDDHKP